MKIQASGILGKEKIMLIKILNSDFEFKDERGRLVQLVHTGYQQINYIFSVADSFRGGHYHKENVECFYVIQGKFEILLELDGRKETHIFQTGDMFCVLPMVIHSFHYMEDTQLLGMYDIGIEHVDGTKDIYSAEVVKDE